MTESTHPLIEKDGYVPDSMYDGVDNQKGYSFVDYSISRIKGTIVVIKES